MDSNPGAVWKDHSQCLISKILLDNNELSAVAGLPIKPKQARKRWNRCERAEAQGNRRKISNRNWDVI
jgi:hypothetical protein